MICGIKHKLSQTTMHGNIEAQKRIYPTLKPPVSLSKQDINEDEFNRRMRAATQKEFAVAD